jgi:histone deacetylase 1/2
LRQLQSTSNISFNQSSTQDFYCTSCLVSKATAQPFDLSVNSSNNVLDLVHSDVWTSPVLSFTGYKYYVIFVDDFSKFTWFYPMRNKHEVFACFQLFKSHVENLFSTTIKFFRSDNGGEFTSKQFLNFLNSAGIFHQLSCPHTPHQNGVAERKHHHISTVGRTLLHHSNLPLTFWVEAFQTAVFLINRTPTPTLSNQSPFQVLFSQPPNYSIFRVFGCLCFPYLYPYNTHKLQNRSTPCIFLGYSSQHKGYRCMSLENGRVYISRHVSFVEHVFPSYPTTSHTSIDSNDNSIKKRRNQSLSILVFTPNSPSTSVDHSTSPNNSPTPSPATSTNISHDIDSPNNNDSIPSPPPPPHHPLHPMKTRAKDGISKPNPKYALLTTTSSIPSEPSSFTQAIKNPQWKNAMADEFNALLTNRTWSLVPYHKGMNVVNCMWVYKIKQKSDGTIERYKARLVAKGYTQQIGIDYNDTFSPVVRHATIRLVLVHSLLQGWSIRQLDIKNAFLHGSLREEVYMAQPPGFKDSRFPNHVCKLHKAIYGLKQAPRAWFSRFSNFLLKHHFSSSTNDPSMFIYRSSYGSMILLLYVDDIILTGSSDTLLLNFLKILQAEFALSDLGPLHYYLGIQVQRTSQGFFLSQSKYATDLLHKANMINCKPVSTPVAGAKLSKAQGSLLADPTPYRQLVGSLQYLTITRPDLSFAVNSVCQFLSHPTTTHMQAVKRILRYVAGTIHHGLRFQPSSDKSLIAFSDSDWAGCPDTRRSTTGFVIFYAGIPVSWVSRKQHTISRSSCEAEYRAVSSTVTELLWLQQLLDELGVILPHPPKLMCDNVSTTYLATNPIFHSRTKHLAIDFHFVREKIASGLLDLRYVPTNLQVADVLTKSLSSSQYASLRDKLLVAPPQST